MFDANPAAPPVNASRAEQFTLGQLTKRDLDPSGSPIPQFQRWFSEAKGATVDPSSSSTTSSDAAAAPAVPHPEACTLSTAELPSGRVSSRVVYLKELETTRSPTGEAPEGSFVLYTNLGTSRKAADLRTNSHASLLFFWEPLQRQVRIEGVASRLTPEESQGYFDSRVRGSRIGAWASRQSQVLQPAGATAQDGAEGEDDGRAQLDGWVREVEERFEGREDIPVPDFWGGLRIVPSAIEFWQGRNNRLHDRFLYTREGEGWTCQRLSP